MIELFTFWIAVCYFTMFINKQVYVILCSYTSGTRATKAYLHENGWHSKIWDLYIFSRDDKFCFSNYMLKWWCYQCRKSSANLTLKNTPPPFQKTQKTTKTKNRYRWAWWIALRWLLVRPLWFLHQYQFYTSILLQESLIYFTEYRIIK